MWNSEQQNLGFCARLCAARWQSSNEEPSQEAAREAEGGFGWGAGQAASALHPQAAPNNTPEKLGPHPATRSAMKGAAPVATQATFILETAGP